MKMELNSVDSQKLILNLLKDFERSVIMQLNIKANAEKDWSEDKREYMSLCFLYALEKKKNEKYCNSWEAICRTIVARQKKVDVNLIKKKDYRDGFGWSNYVQLQRIENGTATMDPGRIETLCKAFDKKADRIFWENLLTAAFPDTSLVFKKENLEWEVLLWMVKTVNESKQMHDMVEILLSKPGRKDEKVFFTACTNYMANDVSKIESDSKLGVPPYKLYPVIRRLSNLYNIRREVLVEEELQTTMQSWWDWKVKWEKAEKCKFEYMPHPRLKKRHLLIMAIVFELDFIETVTFLQIAGHWLGESRMDQKMMRYLLNIPSEGEILDGNELKIELQREMLH